jgi:glycine dehydrogenase subunit 2
MGFDAIHMNLHKTFSTPHGGGGPGAGAVGVSERLKPFLPVPLVVKDGDTFKQASYAECPQTIGQLSAFGGNAGVLIRAYVYARLLGREGMTRVGEYATLNANYLAARLKEKGFDLAYPQRRASHEFIVTVQRQKKENGITALDFSKSLLDYGIHAPTNYFPLLVPECLLIEPTETESKDVLDEFVEVMAELLAKSRNDPAWMKAAPYTTPVRRLDDVKAAKDLDLSYVPPQASPDAVPPDLFSGEPAHI